MCGHVTYLRFIHKGDEEALVRHPLIGRPEVCGEPRLDVRLPILIHALRLLVRLLESHTTHMALTQLLTHRARTGGLRPRCTYVGLAEVDLRQRLGHLRVRVDVVVVQADAAHGAVTPWHAVEAVLLYRQAQERLRRLHRVIWPEGKLTFATL
jgi:hypothetical protein